LTFVKVTANVFDQAGRLLDTSLTYPEPDPLPPGLKTCFIVRFDDTPTGWASYAFEINTWGPSSTEQRHLEVIEHSARTVERYDGRHDYEIIGRVRNPTTVVLRSAELVGTLYNRSRQVIGCDYVYASTSELEPGQISSFKLTYGGYARDYVDVAHYALLPLGRVR